MEILIQFALGFLMLAVTVATNAMMIVYGAEYLLKEPVANESKRNTSNQIIAITLTTLWLAVGLILAMSCWAILLFAIDLFSTFDAAFYFSMVAFTTLGFGDIILPQEWWLLSGFISTDGFIIFGLDTAFLFEVLRRLRSQ